MEAALYTDKTFSQFQKEQINTLFGNKRFLFHILIWLLSAVTFYIIYPENPDSTMGIQHINGLMVNYSEAIRIASTLIGMIISAIFIYTFLLLVIPYSKYKARIRYIILSVIVQQIIFVFVVIILVIWNQFISKFNYELILQSWISIIYIQFNFITLYFFLDYFDKQKSIKKYSKLLEERLIAESKFLTSQINPHFLFNTINNIYSLSLKNKYKSILGIEKLESLIEYIHKKSSQEKISLKDEIRFLNSYIDLELLRYQNSNLDIQFEVNGDIENVDISPLILITFIENAFKHGVRNNKSLPYIHISIEVIDSKILFEIINSFTPQIENHNLDNKIGGIGMQNTLRRLELTYPNAHKIKFGTKAQQYFVELSIATDHV